MSHCVCVGDRTTQAVGPVTNGGQSPRRGPRLPRDHDSEAVITVSGTWNLRLTR